MRRLAFLLCLLALPLGVLQTCGNVGGTSTDAQSVFLRKIPASATDPAINDIIGQHLVAIGPAEGRIGRLLVWYPGTGGRPDQYSTFITRAAEDGYHVIGLAYDNRDTVNFDICPGKPPDCPEKARIEILTGVESGYSPPNVNPDNSAFNRLTKLLEYLDAHYPDEGWGAYLQDGQPRWDLIVVGGHSQGGGHAAMTAKLHEVDRVLLFDATEPAAWTLESFPTAKDRFFGFAHHLESIFTPIVNSWDNLQIPGTLVDVDNVPPPFEGSHRLSTSNTDCRDASLRTLPYHSCPVVDGATPLHQDGTPVFEPVWDYMLGAVEVSPAGASGSSTAGKSGSFPWWIIPVAVGTIVLIGGAGLVVLRAGQRRADDGARRP